MVRPASLAAIVAVLLAASSAHAQFGGTVTAAKNREPYEVAIRCFVANGVAKGQRLDAGDAEKAAYYDRMAKQAHGVAYGFGDVLGLTQAQVTQDFERAIQVEAPAMRRDQAYFYRVVAECKAYKLM